MSTSLFGTLFNSLFNFVLFSLCFGQGTLMQLMASELIDFQGLSGYMK